MRCYLIFILGFVVGVSYAAVASLYVIETIWKSLFHQPKPQRGWWLAPIDWLAVVGVWLGMATTYIQMNVSESIKAIRAHRQTPKQSPVEENERLRAEIERLRAENEKLRSQPKNTSV